MRSYEEFILCIVNEWSGRFPWGVVEVDNPDHSDFTALRNALLR